MKQYFQILGTRIGSFFQKVKAIPQNFRVLPIRTKQLTSLGLTVAMLVALPLFVFTITNLNLNPQKKAASGEVPTPTPTSTSTGIPSPTATGIPSPTAKPTPVNNPPKFTTVSLTAGVLNKKYISRIRVLDADNKSTDLKMIAEGVPPGLAFGNCVTGPYALSCAISGTPSKVGRYEVKVTAYDTSGNSVPKTFILRVTAR